MVEKNAVLYCCYNRPEIVIKSIKHLNNSSINKIYIFRDGPKNNIKDKINCEKVAKIIKNFKFECKVVYKINQKNLGCRIGIQRAINWFFRNEKQGIILEDDIIPTKNFFGFMNYCLERYKNDSRIMMVSGTNYMGSKVESNKYFYSEHFLIWGWATWKRAWKKYDPDMRLWNKKSTKLKIKRKFTDLEYKFLENKFNSLKTIYKDTWDIQWYFNCLYNNGLTIMPEANLVTNIGKEGTHDGPYLKTLFLKFGSINLKRIISPKNIIVNRNFDLMMHKKFNMINFFERMFNFFYIRIVNLFKIN